MKMHYSHALTLLALLGSTMPLYAQSELDEVLSGFDDAPAEQGESDQELDSVLEGFDEPGSIATPQDSQAIVINENCEVPWLDWQMHGSHTLSASYNYAHNAPLPDQTDHRGLSRLRYKLNLDFEASLSDYPVWLKASGYASHDAVYALQEDHDYSDAQIRAYENDADWTELYLSGMYERTQLSIGRQIVVWGKSDNLRVTDIINPMDNRQPGMVDIKDLRLPLTMARLYHPIGDWGITAMAIPEIRFNKMPPNGSDYSAGGIPREEIPESGGDSTEYAVAANGHFSGWDLSLYWAQVHDDTPSLSTTPSGPLLIHQRLTMLGLATNVVSGSWLWKLEGAHFSGFDYGVEGHAEQRNDVLLGMEYNGFRDTNLSLERVQRSYLDYDDQLGARGIEEHEWQTALRYTGDFMHDRLQLIGLITLMGESGEDGHFARYSASYDLKDALELTGGVISYEGGDHAFLELMRDNDRVFVDLKYSF